MGALHDRDFYAWTQEQVRLLRRARDSGSNLARILEHLAELAWSPASDPRRVWTPSVEEHRARVGIRRRRGPSLRRRLPDPLVDAREIALPRIARSLPTLPDGSPLPETCPFTIDQALDPDWYPPAPGPKA